MPKIDWKYAYLEGVRTPTSDYDMVNASYLYNAKQRMRDAYASIKPKYKLGMIKMFKTKPTGLVGWRQMTDYGLHLAGRNGSSIDLYCYYSHYREYKQDAIVYIYRDDYQNTHFYAKSDGISGYQSFDWGTPNKSGSALDYLRFTSRYNVTRNTPSGYDILFFEYVGGNYYYDDVNDIHYGSPDPSYDMENKKWL
ncbi:MAG: hypothetical protein E7Y34_02540 [Mycoplasma sp.]|nr:hypothetical protein [Mycoplasma sp.]